MFQKGDRVIVIPEWRSEAASQVVYEIGEWNIDRGFMYPLNWRELGLSIRPTELVHEEMIKLAPDADIKKLDTDN